MVLAGRALAEYYTNGVSTNDLRTTILTRPAVLPFSISSLQTLLESDTSRSNLPVSSMLPGLVFSLVFRRSFLPILTHTCKARRARVDACKWNGRGRRQNSGKLKLMNNRPPSLFAPRRSFPTLRNARTGGKPSWNKGECGCDGNDDITMTRCR